MLILGKNVNLSEENLNTRFRKIALDSGRGIAPHVISSKDFDTTGTISIKEAENVQESVNTVLVGSDFIVDDYEENIEVMFLNDQTPIIQIEDPVSYVRIKPIKLGLPNREEYEQEVLFPLNIKFVGQPLPSHSKTSKVFVGDFYKMIKSSLKLTDELMVNTIFILTLSSSKGVLTTKDIKPIHIFGYETLMEEAKERTDKKKKEEERLELIRKEQRIKAEEEKQATLERQEAEKESKKRSYARKGAIDKHNKNKKDKVFSEKEQKAMVELSDYQSIIQDILS